MTDEEMRKQLRQAMRTHDRLGDAELVHWVCQDCGQRCSCREPAMPHKDCGIRRSTE